MSGGTARLRGTWTKGKGSRPKHHKEAARRRGRKVRSVDLGSLPTPRICDAQCCFGHYGFSRSRFGVLYSQRQTQNCPTTDSDPLLVASIPARVWLSPHMTTPTFTASLPEGGTWSPIYHSVAPRLCMPTAILGEFHRWN